MNKLVDYFLLFFLVLRSVCMTNHLLFTIKNSYNYLIFFFQSFLQEKEKKNTSVSNNFSRAHYLHFQVVQAKKKFHFSKQIDEYISAGWWSLATCLAALRTLDFTFPFCARPGVLNIKRIIITESTFNPQQFHCWCGEEEEEEEEIAQHMRW